VDAKAALDDAEVELNRSLGASFPDVRLPYLFLRYLAQELNAAPSLSASVVLVLVRSGELSRDFKVCVDLLRDNSLDGLDKDEVPYLKFLCYQ
jgi:hypothetical protein